MQLDETRRALAKTGLARAALPDTFLVSLYRATAPYRGCGHGCRYCDGRAEKYYVDGDFERDIIVRENVAEAVARDVADGVALRESGAVALGSGVTDVYQPIEKELGLTRKTIEALVPTGLPIGVLTKSDLVLRDFDLFAKFPAAFVAVTITTMDERLAALLEPGAPPPEARIEVIRRARAAGFHAGIMAMPMCPGIDDDEESFARVAEAAKEAGAEFVYPGGVTLRPGRQKDFFSRSSTAIFRTAGNCTTNYSAKTGRRECRSSSDRRRANGAGTGCSARKALSR